MVQVAAARAAVEEATTAAGGAPSEPGTGSRPGLEQHRAAPGTAMQHCVSEQILDVAVHFQVVDLGRQLYVWVGTDDARMGSMCVAMPTPPGAASMPPVATLLGGGSGAGGGEAAGASLAQRLARRTGRSMAVAWALPEEPPGLALLAEKRLVQELVALGLAGAARGRTLAS